MYYRHRVHDSATYDIKNTWFILELGLLLIPNPILMAHCRGEAGELSRFFYFCLYLSEYSNLVKIQKCI